MSTMIEVNLNDIPKYLIESELYNTLLDECQNDNKIVNIPEQNFKQDETLNNLNDFENLLQTYRYWIVKKYSRSKFFNFVFKNRDLDYSNIISNFSVEFPMMKEIHYLSIVDIKFFDLGYLISLGYLDLIKIYFQKNKNIPKSIKYFNLAIENDNLKIVMFLHNSGFKGNEESCALAIKNCNIEMLKFLHEIECPWNENTLDYCNDIECLKFAIKNGCLDVIDKSYACENAVDNDCFECFKYLHENGCELQDESITFRASISGKLDFLKYSIDNNCEIRNTILHSILDFKKCQDEEFEKIFECFKYLHENVHFKLNEDLVKICVLRNHLKVLKYLIEKKCPVKKNTLNGFYITDKNKECVEYILNIYPKNGLGLKKYKEMIDLRNEILINNNNTKELEKIKEIEMNLANKFILKNWHSLTKDIMLKYSNGIS